jgi:hypothetical protein
MTDITAEKQSSQKLMIKQYLLLTEDILFLYFASLNTWQAAQSFDFKKKNCNMLICNTKLIGWVHLKHNGPLPWMPVKCPLTIEV